VGGEEHDDNGREPTSANGAIANGGGRAGGEGEKEEEEVVVEEEEDYNDLSNVELLFPVQWFVVPVQLEMKMSSMPSEMAIRTHF
jgi:hypothetical protein